MSTLYDYYSTGNDGDQAISSLTWQGQTFTPAEDFTITSVRLKGHRVLAIGTITVSIRATSGGVPTGSDINSITGTYDGDTLGAVHASPEWFEVILSSGIALDAGTKYAIIVRVPDSGANSLHLNSDGSTPTYTGGALVWSNDSGVTWNETSTIDIYFECWGGSTTPGAGAEAPVDKTYSKKLIAIGHNEVWYESAADTMSDLVAAHNDIDTTEPLTAVEAFQKAFIANNTNLKVVDFANTKLSTADVRPNDVTNVAPMKGTILTGGTTTATMVVDYCDANNGAALIYGYVTSGTFDDDDETITGTNADSTPTAVSFALDAMPVAAPHWYDWAVYPTIGGKSFGTMPTSGYLVSRYRGRLILSGHPDYPHQWYMSKVGDPWNWVYSTTDPLTAVAGNNVDAGKIGDIVRTLIPFGDDFLVFGCANSVHVLDGDPAFGGSIDEVSNKTGIFSWTSWCKDEDGNLYFYGNHGIYTMAGGRSKPVNISKGSLPNLASDWAVNPSTHRVVLSYDAANRGIIIIKTTLADGTCSGYFYSLDVQGFYPISFANAADGIFCSFDYNADDPTYRKLLFGCNDGYLRGFLNTNKNDDYGSASTATISSYFGMVESLSEDSDKEGKLTSLTVEMVGGFEYRITHAALTIGHLKGDILTQATSGATMVVDFTDSTKTHTFGHTITGTWDTTNTVTSDGDGSGFTPTAVTVGSFVNSDGCSYEYHIADDAETCLENLKDGATARESGTLSGTGRKSRIRKRIRGAWLALKFFNSSASETFGINKIFGNTKPTGRIK